MNLGTAQLKGCVQIEFAPTSTSGNDARRLNENSKEEIQVNKGESLSFQFSILPRGEEVLPKCEVFKITLQIQDGPPGQHILLQDLMKIDETALKNLEGTVPLEGQCRYVQNHSHGITRNNEKHWPKLPIETKSIACYFQGEEFYSKLRSKPLVPGIDYSKLESAQRARLLSYLRGFREVSIEFLISLSLE